ncbi:putative bifunctional diguanylate cyclase/phosphodiesterase [Cellulomonas sp. 179-A 4D5 NHS]
MVVPVALWWAAEVSHAPGLPTWVLLVSASLVAGLCLVRATLALRGSEHLAEHDPLTGLANRRGIDRAFTNPLLDGGRSMLLIDVDEFKQVNDTYGHDTGDALLLQIRDRLIEPRPGLELVARLGGDEFVMLAATPHAHRLAQQVLLSMQEPVTVNQLELRVSASIGVADATDDMSLSDLITNADVAMYGAKTSGRNTVAAFQPGMREEVASRFVLTSQVRQLLGARSPDVGKLEIHYQPVVDLITEEHVAAEALVRWRHPEHGLLAPNAFLSLVSTSGLDARLDREVLHAVLRQIAHWQRQGLQPRPISVNLTPDSLADPLLAEQVLTALDETGVAPGALRLEITEHQRLPDDSPAVDTLAVLASAGVVIYLDDYGVGYTSLDYLSRYPVSTLKLDRSLVTGAGTGRSLLVAGVVAMAGTLNLDLLAEGVETIAERDHLIEMGVRYGQGYLFSRPVPADEYMQLVTSAL